MHSQGAVRVLCSVSGAPVRDKLKMLSTTTSKLIFATNAITSTISPSNGGPPPPPKDSRPTPDHKLYPLWCKLQAIKMAEPSSSSLGVSPENSSQAPASFEQSRLSIGSIPTLPISKMRGRGRMSDEPSLGLVSIEISGQLSATASGIDARCARSSECSPVDSLSRSFRAIFCLIWPRYSQTRHALLYPSTIPGWALLPDIPTSCDK